MLSSLLVEGCKGKLHILVWSEGSSSKCTKLHTMAASNKRDRMMCSLYCCLFMLHMDVILHAHPICGGLHNAQSMPMAMAMERCYLQQHPFFYTNRTIAGSFCESCTWHVFHILITAPFCCNWKARAASAQSFTLAASNNRDHMLCSLYYCLFTQRMDVILRAHPVVVNCTFNGNREVVTCNNTVLPFSSHNENSCMTHGTE